MKGASLHACMCLGATSVKHSFQSKPLLFFSPSLPPLSSPPSPSLLSSPAAMCSLACMMAALQPTHSQRAAAVVAAMQAQQCGSSPCLPSQSQMLTQAL